MSTVKRPLMFNEYPEFNDYYACNIVNADYPAVVADTMIAADFDLLGKKVSDLQSGIVIKDGAVSGYLKYLEDYSGYETGASGNFLVLRFYTPGATTTAELVGGTSGAKTVDADGIAIFKITDTSSQSIEVIATIGSDSTTKTYTLTGLTLEAAPEVE